MALFIPSYAGCASYGYHTTYITCHSFIVHKLTFIYSRISVCDSLHYLPVVPPYEPRSNRLARVGASLTYIHTCQFASEAKDLILLGSSPFVARCPWCWCADFIKVWTGHIHLNKRLITCATCKVYYYASTSASISTPNPLSSCCKF